MSRVRSTIRSVRIQEDIDGALQELAKQQRVSVNVLVNESLRKFLDWDVLAEKFGFTVMPSAATKKLINYMSDDAVREFAAWMAQNVFKELVIFWYKRMDLQSTLKAIQLLGSVGNYRYDDRMVADVGTIICRHDMGAKWSLFYEEMFKRTFEDLLRLKVKIETTEDQVLVQFPTTREVFLEGVLKQLRNPASNP